MPPRLPQSIVDIVSARAASTPDALGYAFLASGEIETQRLTWGALDRRSTAIASAIAARVDLGARVLLLFPPGLDFVVAFFGCLRAGAIALPAYPPSGSAAAPQKKLDDRTALRLRAMIGDADVSLIVAPAAVHAKRHMLEALVPRAQRIPWLRPEDVEESTAMGTVAPIARDAVALLQYTSGSTSSPRGVMVTHGNLLDNLACTARVAGCDEESVGVSWLPVNHDMGLIGGILQPAFSGFPMWLMAPAAFLQRPARWLHAISRFRATHSAGPNFAYALCTRRVGEEDRRSLDLSSWRVAYNGSEPVRHGTMEDFQRAFGECGFRWDTFAPAYGLAESTLFVCGTPAGDDPATVDVDRGSLIHNVVAEANDGHDRITLVSSGRPDQTTRVAIVDPERHMPCAGNRVGEIWVAGDSVAAGYWNRPDETRQTFRACIETSGQGPFLRTGDLGFLRNGQLFVTGRLKDVLIVRGANHYPHDLELATEQAHPWIRPGGSAAFAFAHADFDDLDEEGIALVAELDRRGEGSADQSLYQRIMADIRVAVAETHQIQLSAVALVAAGVLPRTTSGKLQRFRCRDAFVAGELPVLAHWRATISNIRKAS